MIEAKLECGETFLFHPPSSPSGDRLREYSVSHAESTRSEAQAVAQVLRKAVGVPPGAKPAEVICIDCGDPGETLVSGQWVQDDETNVVQIYLRPGVGTWVVQLVWSRRRGA
jgi:hypothetical protein